MNARAEYDGILTELETCRGENADLRDRLDRTTDELRRRASDLVDVERRMDDIHDQLISARNSLESANEDRRRLRDELHISQRNSTAASEQLMVLRKQFSKLRTEGDDHAAHRQNGTGCNEEHNENALLTAMARDDALPGPPESKKWTEM